MKEAYKPESGDSQKGWVRWLSSWNTAMPAWFICEYYHFVILLCSRGLQIRKPYLSSKSFLCAWTVKVSLELLLAEAHSGFDASSPQWERKRLYEHFTITDGRIKHFLLLLYACISLSMQGRMMHAWLWCFFKCTLEQYSLIRGVLWDQPNHHTGRSLPAHALGASKGRETLLQCFCTSTKMSAHYWFWTGLEGLFRKGFFSLEACLSFPLSFSFLSPYSTHLSVHGEAPPPSQTDPLTPPTHTAKPGWQGVLISRQIK